MKRLVISLFIILVAATLEISAHEHGHKKDSLKMSMSDLRADSLMQIKMAEHQQMEAISAFPNFHPLVVHFPIVMLMMAFVFQIISFFYFKKEFGRTTLILLALGVITAWLSMHSFHADTGLLKGKAAVIFAAHERMASYTWWFALVALLTKIASDFLLLRKWWIESASAVLLGGAAVFVAITGHLGAQLVYTQGIGPVGKYLESYHSGVTTADSLSSALIKSANDSSSVKSEAGEDDHHVGEIGKGPHGGTVEEADPDHMEISTDGNDLIFYLLDGDAKPLDMKAVSGSVSIHYANARVKTISLMMMAGRLTAMRAVNKQSFTAICTLTDKGKSYSASFDSKRDLPLQK
jgi:uncharacterized membrane protein